MDADKIRTILGMLAGGLVGKKVGKGEPVGGFTGGLAGVVGGLFSATLVNSIGKIFQSATGKGQDADIELRENLCEVKGFMNGLALSSGMILGFLEGLGLSEQQIFEVLGIQNTSEANDLIVSRRTEVQSAIEHSISNMYDSMENQLGGGFGSS